MPYVAPLQSAITRPTIGLICCNVAFGGLGRWSGIRLAANLLLPPSCSDTSWFGPGHNTEYVFGSRRGEYARTRPIWRGVIAGS